MTAEVPPVRCADFLRRAMVFANVRHEDLHTDQVSWMRPGSLEGLDDIAGRYIELLGHRGANNGTVQLLCRLPAKVDRPAFVSDDRVGESRGTRKGLGVANFVGAAYRPLHFASRPSRNA